MRLRGRAVLSTVARILLKQSQTEPFNVVQAVLDATSDSAKQGEELAYVPQFLVSAQELANRAGGEAPRPARPETKGLEEIRLTAGNEQLLALYNQRDELSTAIDTWTDLAERIDKRMPAWNTLKRLLAQAKPLAYADLGAADSGFQLSHFCTLLVDLTQARVRDSQAQEVTTFWDTFGPLPEKLVRVALEQAVRLRGNGRHVRVYLSILRTFVLNHMQTPTPTEA